MGNVASWTGIGIALRTLGVMKERSVGFMNQMLEWVGDAGVEIEEKGVVCRKFALGGKKRVWRDVMYRLLRDDRTHLV